MIRIQHTYIPNSCFDSCVNVVNPTPAIQKKIPFYPHLSEAFAGDVNCCRHLCLFLLWFCFSTHVFAMTFMHQSCCLPLSCNV